MLHQQMRSDRQVVGYGTETTWRGDRIALDKDAVLRGPMGERHDGRMACRAVPPMVRVVPPMVLVLAQASECNAARRYVSSISGSRRSLECKTIRGSSIQASAPSVTE